MNNLLPGLTAVSYEGNVGRPASKPGATLSLRELRVASNPKPLWSDRQQMHLPSLRVAPARPGSFDPVLGRFAHHDGKHRVVAASARDTAAIDPRESSCHVKEALRGASAGVRLGLNPKP